MYKLKDNTWLPYLLTNKPWFDVPTQQLVKDVFAIAKISWKDDQIAFLLEQSALVQVL
jgi:hypothetical protein